jgi:hypothetical protein
MEKTKVTSDALRKMEMGQTVTFELPDADAINSGKAIAYRIQNSLRCKFTAVSDYANNRLTLTKNAQS